MTPASILVLLVLAGFAAFAGLGFMWSAGANKDGSGAVGKIVFVLVGGFFLVAFLSQPGADTAISDTLTAVGGNVSRGVQPAIAWLIEAAGFALVLIMTGIGGYAFLTWLKNRPPPRRREAPTPRRERPPPRERFWE